MGTLIHTNDQEFFNCIAREVNKLAGMYCYYYTLLRNDSTRDPVWDEMVDTEFQYETDGKKLACFAINPEHATMTGEEGRRTQWDAEIWVARIDWEETMADDAIPQNGDVVNCWGEFFDIVDYDKDGVMDDDRRVYVLWKLSLRRMTKHEAFRRPVIEE